MGAENRPRRSPGNRPRGRSSVGRALASQAKGRGFEARRPLHPLTSPRRVSPASRLNRAEGQRRALATRGNSDAVRGRIKVASDPRLNDEGRASTRPAFAVRKRPTPGGSRAPERYINATDNRTRRFGFQREDTSFTVLPGGGSWPTCRHCGSTIYPQRFESSKVRSIGGARLTVDKFRCRAAGPRGPPAAGGRGCLSPAKPSARAVEASTATRARYSGDAIGERAGKWAAATKATG